MILQPFFILGMEKEDHKNYRWYDEFSGEQTNCRNCAVGNERKGCEWVHNGVYIRKPLEPFKTASSKPVPEGTVSAKENFHRTKSPSEDLVQSIRQVDGCRSFECRPYGHAVN
jgi:hypothetical protein